MVEPGPPAADRIEDLRAELLGLVEERLTPIARDYGYSEVPLETNIKWRPQVLILGNYSSGKSTLINELLGAEIQATGQAPTDDSFTVITCDDAEPPGGPRTTEERDGKVLLSDPQYPYAGMKRHGARFASHFRLKKVSSPFLKHLAIIDTPGMLDSIAERDRGYDYQEVIGDLAQIADLVLVLFDPHKAGTVRETYASLRDTLPARTFEDRLLIVLNRVDECESLGDLLRVYGTLCWNLSQMLGRKDIPPILLTYAEGGAVRRPEAKPGYLTHLINQRDELRRLISQAPRYRLDHLAAYVEVHGERLAHLLEALLAYVKARRLYRIKCLALGGFFLALAAAGAFGFFFAQGLFGPGAELNAGAAALLFAAAYAAFALFGVPGLVAAQHRRLLARLDALTPLDQQARRDSWQHVKAIVKAHLERTGGKLKAGPLRAQHNMMKNVRDHGTPGIRSELNALPAPKRL